MPEQSEKKFSRPRLYLLSGFLMIVLGLYVAVLADTQLVHGEDYLEKSVRTITRTERVPASRGVLTDRNGQVLVTNRQTYNLTFDRSLLTEEDDENACILRLLQLLSAQNLSWADNLPLSRGGAPYSYGVDGLDDTQKGRFVEFLQAKMKLISADSKADDVTEALLNGAGFTADALFADLRAGFSIPADWSDADARNVLGVLYELSVRELVNTTAYVLTEDVSSSMVALLNDGSYRGAKVVSATAREYQTSSAAHILGYVSAIDREEYEARKDQGYELDAIIGKTGAEAAFESYLRGVGGRRVVSTNAAGKITGEYYSTAPQPGSTVQLTIDIDFQQAVETALGGTVSKMTDKDGIVRGAGAAVVQVGTGEVLALASYPTYDPATVKQNFTQLSADPAGPLFNRATSGTYAPGSTFKPCTAIAALQEGVISTSEKIRDTGIWYYPGATTGDYARCWYHAGHGLLNVTQAITNSCNYFFAEMGYRLGLDTLNRYASAFGLGRHTGIEIGDYAGLLATQEPGQNLAPWAAFGQASYLFTPLQLSNYIATLASGGDHYAAHLLRQVKSYDNTQVLYAESGEPENSMDIRPANLNAVKQGMHALTTTGSLSSYFSQCVVDAGAKTGTAQVTSQTQNNGVFVCFAPYEKPEVAVAIVIEKGGSGAALASTAVEILNAWFTQEQIGAVILGENQLLP